MPGAGEGQEDDLGVEAGQEGQFQAVEGAVQTEQRTLDPKSECYWQKRTPHI